MSRRQQLWMLLAVFVIATILRIGLVNRSGLWGDEAFSLAIATGHSLEQPAAVARPELGDSSSQIIRSLQKNFAAI